MKDAFIVRQATTADGAIIAHHRVAMFMDMGRVGPSGVERLREATAAWLAQAMPRGEYLGWLAAPCETPERTVAGAGVQVRRVLPFPWDLPDGRREIAEGRQAIIVNVYTDPEFRRRRVARRLLEAILAWARSTRLESLVLHAAPDGRRLYESMGFAPTNEMRFMGDLTTQT
jgi:GNAT superfamily N-acetyltransferase